MSKRSPAQMSLPNFAVTVEYVCPFCDEPATLFGQYSPLFPWGVCRECSIKYPYPVELFVPSTRRNKEREPLMIDTDPAKSALRDQRVQLDEMLRCAIDPTRIERPIVKYNLSGLELRNPIRRSKAHKYQQWHVQAMHNLTMHQMSLPVCSRCGSGHDRFYDMGAGRGDYHTRCQRCDDEMAVEALFKGRSAIFNNEDEGALDRIYRSHPELFARGVLPDYWFELLSKRG